MKIAFYISGRANRLCEIIKDQRFKKIFGMSQFVLNDSFSESENIHKLCEDNKVSWIFYDYKNASTSKTRKERNTELSDYILFNLKKYKVDYLFVFGHHLLSGELLKEYKYHIICFHPSLLPHYKGFSGIDQAVENKDFVIGNSAFFIDEGIDTGEVIIQSVMHISNFGSNKNYESLLHPIVDMFYYLIKILLEDRIKIEDGKIHIVNANYGKVHFWPELEGQ